MTAARVKVSRRFVFKKKKNEKSGSRIQDLVYSPDEVLYVGSLVLAY